MTPSEKNKANDALNEAEAAAKRGDAAGMVRQLFASRAIDGLVWKLGRDFHGSLAPVDVHDCVAEAVADAFAALAGGKRLTTLMGYLFKSARNMAVDLVAESRHISTRDVSTLRDSTDADTDADRDEVRRSLQAEALRRARLLLPQLGQDNIQRVMELVFDAIEKEVVDLTDVGIAEITGLKEDTVRRLKNRGFERLTRLAKENGFNLVMYQRAVGAGYGSDTDDHGRLEVNEKNGSEWDE